MWPPTEVARVVELAVGGFPRPILNPRSSNCTILDRHELHVRFVPPPGYLRYQGYQFVSILQIINTKFAFGRSLSFLCSIAAL